MKFKVTRTLSIEPVSVTVEVEATSAEEAAIIANERVDFDQLDEVDLQERLQWQEEIVEVLPSLDC